MSSCLNRTLAAWGLSVAFLLSGPAGNGQVTVVGIVRDSATREPVPFVNVFLANTTRGTVTDEAGRFSLQNVPVGSFDLLISHIGYRLFRETISTRTDRNLAVLLRPQSEQLNEVVVRSRRRRSRPEDYQRFKTLFLGNSTFSRACRIENPNDVYAVYDPATRRLSADAPTFLGIENPRLGYLVKFYGLTFQCDFNENSLSYVGWPVFEELRPRNAAQRRRWQQAREVAYRGSLPHFLRSVRRNSLTEEGFSVHRLRQVVNPRRHRADGVMKAQFEANGVRSLLFNENPGLTSARQEPEYLTKISVPPLPLDSLRRVEADSARIWLQFNDQLYVVYAPEEPDANYFVTSVPGPRTLPAAFTPRQGQASVLYLLLPRVEIGPEGQLDPPLGVFNEGYWGFERMGEFLPADYQPPAHSIPTKP